MKRFGVTALALAILLSFALGAWGGYYDKPRICVRALGMGGVISLAAEDSSETVRNPAILGLMEGSELRYNLSQGAISSGFHLGKLGNLGLTASDREYADRFVDNKLTNPIGTFRTDDNHLLLSYSKKLHSRFSIGGSLTYRMLKDSSWGRGYDLGILVKPAAYLSLGGSVTDIRDTQIYKDGQLLDSSPQEVSLGAMLHLGKYANLAGSIDYPNWKPHLGAEVGMKGFYLRAGAMSTGAEPAWTAGLSLKIDSVELDYTYVNDPNLEHRHMNMISVALKFPGKTQKPEKIEKVEKIEEAEKPEEVEKIEEPEEIKIEEPEEKRKPIAHTGQMSQLVQDIAKQHNIELPLLLALIKTESAFRPDAVSSAGAVGLMQLMPGTAGDLGLRVPQYKDIKKPNRNPNVDERFDPAKNVAAGAKYLGSMLKRYDGNYVLALAAYNAGPGRVSSDVPLIRETERYANKVLNSYYQYKNFPQALAEALQSLDAM